MKSISAGLATHLAGATTTLCTCLRIERRDGLVVGLTDHDRDLSIAGIPYRTATGAARASLRSAADLSVDETEVTGFVDATDFTERSIRAGLWDGATFRIFAVNWSNLGQGELRQRRGTLGEVTLSDNGSFRAELRGLAQALQTTVGQVYSPECRADLGDARCRVPLRPGPRADSTVVALGVFARVPTGVGAGSYAEEGVIYECTTPGTTAATAPAFSIGLGSTTADGSVVWTARTAWTRPASIASAPDASTLVLADDGIGGFADGWFESGVAVFETGAIAGVARDVTSWTAASRTLSLFLALPFPPSAGDVLRVQPGCDKRLATCRDRFANRLNFRGEPAVPGTNAIVGTPL